MGAWILYLYDNTALNRSEPKRDVICKIWGGAFEQFCMAFLLGCGKDGTNRTVRDQMSVHGFDGLMSLLRVSERRDIGLARSFMDGWTG